MSLLFCLIATTASAASLGTRDEAVAMTRAAVAMFNKDGAEKTLQAISDKSFKPFHNGDLYPFVYDTKGICVAHGARPALVGKNLYDLKDQDGKYLIREMIQRSRQGEGWISYKWPNPITNAIEDKATFFMKMGDDYLVGVGVYGEAK